MHKHVHKHRNKKMEYASASCVCGKCSSPHLCGAHRKNGGCCDYGNNREVADAAPCGVMTHFVDCKCENLKNIHFIIVIIFIIK